LFYPEMRKDCPMRATLGNCGPVGGFCFDAVSDEICEAVHNAYYSGQSDAINKIVRRKDCRDYLTAYCPCDTLNKGENWFCGDGRKKDENQKT